MAKKPAPLPEKGASSAQEIYELVGVALSWWEASEDVILGLFRTICDAREPVALAAFIQAPRNVRYSMLRLAMTTYQHRFENAERQSVEAALRGLDRLAPVRNEIAHGHVSDFTSYVDDEVTASGNYLLPSLNEGTFHERTFRFHHTPESIVAFVTDLRKWRGDVMDVSLAVMTRTQEMKNFGMDALAFMQTVERVARLEVHGYDAVDLLKAVISAVDTMRPHPSSGPPTFGTA